MSTSPSTNLQIRETSRHYIPASDSELSSMLAAIGVSRLEDLFSHLDTAIRFSGDLNLPEELSYSELQQEMQRIAAMNATKLSFIGDGLPVAKTPAIVAFVSSLRKLTTSYTPYQPERSQGTLLTHWIYQCLLSRLTGFEAVNSSLYDRSTALYEAICCAVRLSRKADTALVSGAIYPGDLEVLATLSEQTGISIRTFPVDAATGTTDFECLEKMIAEAGDRLAAIAFPQVNTFGLLEDVDRLADLAVANKVRSVAIVDPGHLGTGGLKPPTDFGTTGVDIFVGEGQHLAIPPTFGGPGLGIFGIRFNDSNRSDIRSAPGRLIGKAVDRDNRECRVMVMSTREQHIRRDKATSNICSNQAFLATLAGAAVLARGEEGMKTLATEPRRLATRFAEIASTSEGFKLAFPASAFFNEVTLEFSGDLGQLLSETCGAGIHIGVDVSERQGSEGRKLIKFSFSDIHSDADVERLTTALGMASAPPAETTGSVPAIDSRLLRVAAVNLPGFSEERLQDYYSSLAELNVSPDDGCFPLGSCTMKYNPLINDWAAGLPGFVNTHPQAPAEDVQGNLAVLYEIQEWFKGITGLPGVTTQPVAGAQGELVGLKLFQAYHAANGQSHRNIVLIPKSAHGTNFATASMAGFPTRKIDGKDAGIVLLEGDHRGCVDLEDLKAKLALHGDRVAGIMITNPNTCGIFETDFKHIAAQIHAVGGLVYMDGANMNAIAGWTDLNAMGVDAVHNNLHKTWTIPHGGGGPGDAIVAVSEKLVDFLPGMQVVYENGTYRPVKPSRSIGSFHRHWGNFGHKIRCLTYLKRLGRAGVPRMSAVAVLAARYLYHRLRPHFSTLPSGSDNEPRMHEFILTLAAADFAALEAAGVQKALAITQIGKTFLDFGFHAPTVSWPEQYGFMIEPTESYTKAELDRFADAVTAIQQLITECPAAIASAPHFTPIDRVDEVAANRSLTLYEDLSTLPDFSGNRISPSELSEMTIEQIKEKIIAQVAVAV